MPIKGSLVLGRRITGILPGSVLSKPIAASIRCYSTATWQRWMRTGILTGTLLKSLCHCHTALAIVSVCRVVQGLNRTFRDFSVVLVSPIDWEYHSQLLTYICLTKVFVSIDITPVSFSLSMYLYISISCQVDFMLLTNINTCSMLCQKLISAVRSLPNPIGHHKL